MKNAFLLLLSLTILVTTACNRESQEEIDEALIQEYLADNNIDAQEVAQGLYYVIDVEGTGTETPTINDDVKVEYTGYLMDGSEFDSNVGSDIIVRPLRAYIRGWQIGIPEFTKNAQGRLFVPSTLAYGDDERPGIPENSILIFNIRLVNFY